MTCRDTAAEKSATPSTSRPVGGAQPAAPSPTGPTLPDDQRILLEAIVSLHDADDARALFDDLLTPREVEDLAQRLTVARMLDAGVPYVRIQQVTGASATTVARVARCLKYGPGGYRSVLSRLPAYEPPAE